MKAYQYITKEVANDSLTPITCYSVLGGAGCCILESAHEKGQDKTSLIGINPFATLTANGRSVQINLEDFIHRFEADPYEALKGFCKHHKAFGFISYDAVRIKENIPDRHPKGPIPEFLFHLYRTVITFDHARHKITFAHQGNEAELDALIERCHAPIRLKAFGRPGHLEVTPDLSNVQFSTLVEQAKAHITAGDIFQVVLSRTFHSTINASPFDIYRAIRHNCPAPYLFFFEEEDYALAGASPELLISVQNGHIETVPIAGTRPKECSAEELLMDPKECAEHVMLVDLSRNDLGIVAKPGTVQVTEYQTVRSYSHVHHIVSRVEAELNPTLHSLDALKAAFPAGTLSGAPKIRAMQIIDQLENNRRGPYGGAVVAIDEEGNLISCISIRMAQIFKDRVEVRTGAGIVLDSIPAQEALETEHKAKGILEALALCAGGQS